MLRPLLFVVWAFAWSVPAFGQPDPQPEESVRKEAEEAFQKAFDLRVKGRNKEALPFAERAAELAPRAFGADDRKTAVALNGLGTVYYHVGRPADAEKAFHASLAICEKRAKEEPAALVSALGNISKLMADARRFDEAEKLQRRCLAIDESLPNNDERLVFRLQELTALYFDMHRIRDADELLKRCVALQEKVVGRDHWSLVKTLSGLSSTACKLGRWQEAEAMGRRAVRIIESLEKGADDVRWVETYVVLGDACTHVGKEAEAEAIFRRCLSWRERTLGKEHPLVARSLTRLAQHLVAAPQSAEPEALLRRAIAICEKTTGPDHPGIANPLLYLSQWLVKFGRYDEAEKLVVRSVAILEKVGDEGALGPHLQALGNLQFQGDRYHEAEKTYRRCYDLMVKIVGPEHHETMAALNDVARTDFNLGRPAQAAKTQKRIVEIVRKRLPPTHPFVIGLEHCLAQYYLKSGRDDDAMKLLHECLKNAEAGVGPDSVSAARIHRSLAHAEYDRKNPAQAVLHQTRLLESELRAIHAVFGFGSEATMLSYVQQHGGLLPTLLIMANACRNDGKTAEIACDWTLRFHGAVFDTICRYQHARALSPDPEFRSRLNEYRALKQRIADGALKSPVVGETPDGSRKRLDRLESELNEVVSKRDASLANPRAVSAASVRAKLPPKSALVNYVDFATPKGRHVMAFVVAPGQTSARLVDIGPARAVDEAVEALRNEIDDFQRKLKECETVAETHALEKALEPSFRKKASNLYAKIVGPLGAEVAAAELLYLVPDGPLHRVPFEALVDDEGKYLAETRRCAYLSSGRDLLRPVAERAQGVTVFAGPDFKLAAADRQAVADKILGKNRGVALRGGRGERVLELRSAGWKALPGAAGEADDIQRILSKSALAPVKTYTGAEAMEEVLKALPPPRILHLATHGFYLDHEAEAVDDDDPIGVGGARRRLRKQDNPLLRSGIVLAGANAIGDNDSAGGDDGWVTAEEIALLNLRGTDLVVLSACQTGLGDVRTGEGVFGLRRAFLYAGASSLLTSLFEVPDDETRDLMRRFYQGLKIGQSKSDALSAAQRAMIAQRRQSHGAAHPFYWASFVLIGDPR